MKRNEQNERAVSTAGREREVVTAEREELPENTRRLTPACDVYETEDKVVVLADMPGVEQGDLDVTLHRGLLTMRGRIRPSVPEGFTPYDREPAATAYQRSLALSAAIDDEGVHATIRDGVLRIELTKRPEERPRRIAINRK